MVKYVESNCKGNDTHPHKLSQKKVSIPEPTLSLKPSIIQSKVSLDIEFRRETPFHQGEVDQRRDTIPHRKEETT